MTEDFPWYHLIDDKENLEQGDFIENCPIVVPFSHPLKHIDVNIKQFDVIIMSQSCDLSNKKIEIVLTCPYWHLANFGEYNGFFRSSQGKETLRRGNAHGYHLLNRCDLEGFETDYLVVDFRNVFGVPFDYLLKLIRLKSKRLRLLPPYKEHLSQAFARFFMRVGLPIDIPPFE